MKTGAPQAAEQSGAGSVAETLSFWQPRSTRPLLDSDGRQIVTNLTSFFEVLLDWESREREEAAPVNIEVSKASD
jgi:hypothetical protein